MSAVMKIRKVTTLPGTFENSTLYLVPNADASLFDMYLSASNGASVRRIISKSDIATMIADAISGAESVQIVADIAARNALNPTTITQVLVLDASADATVTSGAATYIYNPDTTSWIKINEAESMDVVLNWVNIVGKPSSSVADIDDAVTKRHTHANKSVLDDISDQSGYLGYKGAPVRAYLDAEEW